MLAGKIGPYFHPKDAHPHPYWVYPYTMRPNVFLVVKCDPYSPSEYDVELANIKLGTACQCPHYTNRKLRCLHIDMVRDAQETYNLWKKTGWVKEE